jgi:hypothetical protein
MVLADEVGIAGAKCAGIAETDGCGLALEPRGETNRWKGNVEGSDRREEAAIAKHSLGARMQLVIQVGSEVIIAVIFGVTLGGARRIYRWKTWWASMLTRQCWQRQRWWERPKVKSALLRQDAAGPGGIPLDLPIGTSR